MSQPYRVLARKRWGVSETVVMVGVLVGMLIPWILWVTAPRDGTVPAHGIVISLLAGGYLAFLVFGYLRY